MTSSKNLKVSRKRSTRSTSDTITRCKILRLKFTKFDFGWGTAPDLTAGAYSAPPDP